MVWMGVGVGWAYVVWVCVVSGVDGCVLCLVWMGVLANEFDEICVLSS